MDTFIRERYLNEVATQCRYAIDAGTTAAAVTRNLLEAPKGGGDELASGRRAEIFRSIHSLLTHASNVSRLLWPAPPRQKQGEGSAEYNARRSAMLNRGSELRTVLQLAANGHVLHKRTLRDHLDHFDERLDAWAANGRHQFANDNIGPVGAIKGFDPVNNFRWFDPVGQFWFRGEMYDLGAMMDALRDVEARAAALSTT